MEIQVNGGSISDKVDYARSLLEKPINVDSIFSKDEVIDIVGVNKGKGEKGKYNLILPSNSVFIPGFCLNQSFNS